MSGLDVDGLEQLQRSLDAAGRALEDLTPAHERAGELLEGRAQADAPRLTGRMAGQHELVVHAGGLTITNAARYAPFVHARQPWLTRALDALQRQVVDIYSNQVDQIVDDIRGA